MMIAQPPASGRDRYLAVLLGVALVHVVAHHAYGAGWLSFLFPSMGVLFAVAGSLTAAGFDHLPAGRVVRHRLRGLLLPFWALGLVVVPAMLWHGWTLRWLELAYWVLPVLDPPASQWGVDATQALWYVRASLWFVLLSPAALAAFRRWPVATVLAPIALVAIPAFGVVDLTRLGPAADALTGIGTYGPCWVLGFAHRAGLVRRVPLPGIAGLAAGSMLLGGAWALVHRDPVYGYDLDAIPMAQALWCLGAVLLLLRWSPQPGWLDRLSRLGAFVHARALTAYLWHGVAIALADPVNDRLGLYAPVERFATPLLLVIAAVLVFGWVEDIAAGRRPALLPGAGRDADALLLGGRRSETGRLGL